MIDNIPERVCITWYINVACNYRCPYCQPEKYIERRENFEKIIKIWEKIYMDYGPCHISFSGGEPTIYPDFFKMLKGLVKYHTIELITNLSFNVDKFINNFTPEQARIGASFHPDMVDFESFFEKVKKIHLNEFEIWVTYVGYPPNLGKLGYYKERVEELGVHFSILPFNGSYNGKNYPRDYTGEERKIIFNEAKTDQPNKETVEWKLVENKDVQKGKICKMGFKYARIYPDGNAYRCCAKEAEFLGNIYEGTFKLFEEPKVCKIEHCPCWKCMIVGEEDRWKNYWIIPYRVKLNK